MEILDENNIQLFGQSIQTATTKLNILTQIICQNLQDYFEQRFEINIKIEEQESIENQMKQVEKIFDQQDENVKRCEIISKTLEKIKKHISIVKEGLKPLEQFVKREFPPTIEQMNQIIEQSIPIVESALDQRKLSSIQIDEYIEENYEKYKRNLPGKKINKEEKALERHLQLDGSISFDEMNQIEEWSNFHIDTIIFNSEKDDWNTNSSIFD